MRILFLTDSYRPSRSACANRVSVLVDAMRAAGIDVQVLASSDSLLDADGNYEKPGYVTFFKTFPLQEKTLVNRLRNNFLKTVVDFSIRPRIRQQEVRHYA